MISGSDVARASFASVLLCAATITGCAEPSVDRLAVWIDSIDTGEGRKLRVYDHGEQYALDLIPEVAGSELRDVSISVDPRARGFAAGVPQRTAYVSLADGRVPALAASAALGGELLESFAFTRNGDALLRAYVALPAQGVLMPTSSAEAGEVFELAPPEPVAGGSFALLQAADAPVLIWSEQIGNPARGWGQLQALAYPSDVDAGRPPVDDMVELGRSEVFGSAGAALVDLRIPGLGCEGRVCVDPGGRSVVATASARCSFWRWNIGETDPATGEDVLPELFTLEDGCPLEPRAAPALIAQIGEDLLVLDDERRVYLADLTAGTIRSTLKLWPTAGFATTAQRGRAVVLVADDGRMVRVDADGPRVLAATSVPCPGRVSTPKLSPNGMWAVRTCAGDGTFTPEEQSIIVRTSPLGTETFASVQMEPLGIDDGGNALLYSRVSSGEPRGLFVLDAEGRVSRVNALEPEPEQVRTGAQTETYFATAD